MIQPFKQFKRQVVPNWRSFTETITLGELSNSQTVFQKDNLIITQHLESLIVDWLNNKDIGHAADLISIASINDIINDSVIEAADYIIGNRNRASVSLYSLAAKILGVNTAEGSVLKKIVSDTNDVFKEYKTLKVIYERIQLIKVLLSKNPKNAIQWVELSRLYSILGQKRKAKDTMKIAINLAPQNRFVTRAATRLFIHYKEIDFIHDFLRKHEAIKYDPWIVSAEMAAASLRGRTSIFVKVGQNMISSNDFSNFSLTELSSSIGTIELANGSFKKSREYFKKSLIAPNDNSLAQFQWAATTVSELNLVSPDLSISNSHEAFAIKAYDSADWNSVIDHCTKWFLDMPYSRRPLLIGSYVASVFTHNLDKAISMCEAGLVSHPNDAGLINNLAFALALKGNHQKANEEISKVTYANSLESNFLKATKGLIAFRRGDPDEGRKLYGEVIENLSNLEDKYFVRLAFLNYLREEILVNNNMSFATSLMQIISKFDFDPKHSDLFMLKNQIIDLYHKKLALSK